MTNLRDAVVGGSTAESLPRGKAIDAPRAAQPIATHLDAVSGHIHGKIVLSVA
jgi:hypothetical protein